MSDSVQTGRKPVILVVEDQPDERFLAMREHVDKFEEGISLSERLFTRVRNRTNGEYPPFARACGSI